MLELKNVSVSVGNKQILDDISFTLCPGQWLMLIGPNGAGKSTLVNVLSRKLTFSGEVFVNQKSIRRQSGKVLAASLGFLAQSNYMEYAFSVEEVVRLGRYRQHTSDDSRLVEEALKATGMYEKRLQSALTLSGGEAQRMFLAQALAQDPEILVLDEPANHLDLKYQKQVFELVGGWLSDRRAVISVVHDLSLAKRYGTHALLLDNGKIVCSGKKESVLAPENLNAVYDMDVYCWMNDTLRLWNN